jgi:hypothetical protein
MSLLKPNADNMSKIARKTGYFSTLFEEKRAKKVSPGIEPETLTV